MTAQYVCCDFSKNRFDLANTFGHTTSANGRVKISGCNTVHDK